MDCNNLADRNIPKSEPAEGKYDEGKRHPTWNSPPHYNSFPCQNLSPSKNRPTTFHFFLRDVYIVMVTYHHHLMDVINFNYSLTPLHKPKQREKVTSCTWSLQLLEETFWLKTNLSSRADGMQKSLQSPLFLLRPSGHFQHPDVELLALHIQLLLYFSKASQFFLRYYDIEIAICITISCTKGATYCAVSQRLQFASASYQFMARLFATKWKYHYKKKGYERNGYFLEQSKSKSGNITLCATVSFWAGVVIVIFFVKQFTRGNIIKHIELWGAKDATSFLFKDTFGNYAKS